MTIGATFETKLRTELASTEELLDCLKQEQAALQQTKSDQLETITQQKIALLQTMTQHAIERAELLSDHGLQDNKKSIEDFIHTHAPTAVGVWKALLETTRQLEVQNRLNGGLIQLGQQRTQMALDILTQPSNTTKTYGKTGIAQPDATSFTSVKA